MQSLVLLFVLLNISCATHHSLCLSSSFALKNSSIEPLPLSFRHFAVPNTLETLLDPCTLSKNDVIDVSLFEDVSFTLLVDFQESNNISCCTAFGYDINNPSLRFSLSRTDKEFLFLLPHYNLSSNSLSVFKIFSSTSSDFVIVSESLPDEEVDSNEPDFIQVPSLDDFTQPLISSSFPTSSSDEPTTISIMVVYTSRARNWANSRGGITNIINNVVAESNMVFSNSNVGARLDLVYSGEIAYTETGNSVTDLYRLTFHRDFDPWSAERDTGGYHMDSVHSLRSIHGADLVVLLTETGNSAGVAWATMTPLSWIGFSVDRIDQIIGSPPRFVFVHELGHNLGAGHHAKQNFQPGPQMFSYSAGWRWFDSNNKARVTVMSYDHGRFYADGVSGTMMPHFSNPNVYFNGFSTGHVTEADNARTIQQTKIPTSNFYEPLSTSLGLSSSSFASLSPSPTISPWFGTVVGGQTVIRSGHLDHVTSSKLSLTITGPTAVSFNLRSSSERNYDFVSFYINNELKFRTSGNTDWQNFEEIVTDTSVLFSFEYSKDESVSHFDDCGYISAFSFDSVYTVSFSTDGSEGTSLSSSATQFIKRGGSTVAVEAFEGNAFRFSHWLINSVPMNHGETSLIISNLQHDTSVVAIFVPLTVTVTYSAGSGGLITGDASQTIPYLGTTTEVLAVANIYYEFSNWSDGLLSESRFDENVDSIVEYIANFERTHFMIEFLIEGNGTLTGSTSQIVPKYQDGEQVEAISDEDFVFLHWIPNICSASTCLITNISSDITLTAVFGSLYLTVTIKDGDNGSVEGGLEQILLRGESSSEFSAVPAFGHEFLSWSDGVTNNPRRIENIQQDFYLTPIFGLISYRLTFTPFFGGKIVGEPIQNVPFNSSSSLVTATAYPGFKFSGWSDGTSSPQLVLYHVSDDVSLCASFHVSLTAVVLAVGVVAVFCSCCCYGCCKSKPNKPILVTSVPESPLEELPQFSFVPLINPVPDVYIPSILVETYVPPVESEFVTSCSEEATDAVPSTLLLEYVCEDSLSTELPTVGSTVSVHFSLLSSEGEVLQTSRDEEEFVFELGAANVLPCFNDAVAQLLPGQRARFDCSSSCIDVVDHLPDLKHELMDGVFLDLELISIVSFHSFE
ncbi:hypothetical protein RCL1_003364 [Eukaryota sp. TZLM3-RCL]